MATTKNLTTLKINYLSQAQYDEALTNGQINADELYFTPSDNAPSVTIQLNGANVTSPSFYAPIDSGTSGQILMSEGEGEDPAWVNGELTDEEVKINNTGNTAASFPLLLGPVSTVSGSTYSAYFDNVNSLSWNPAACELSTSNELFIAAENDFEVIVGDAQLGYSADGILSLGKVNAYDGSIRLYRNDSAFATWLKPGSLTANRTITIPDKSGTLAITTDIPTNIVNTITTAAGAHTAISNRSGAVTFNIPTTAAHVGAIATTNERMSGAFIDGYNNSTSIKVGINATNISDSVQYLFGARTIAPVLYNDTTDTIIWTGYTTANKPSAADVTTGTFPGRVIAAADTSYTTAQLRNIILSTSAPGSTSAVNGTVWIQYQA